MISAKEISFGYRKREQLFYNLSMDIESGIVGLLGKNGAGKSTMLKFFAGLLVPDSGEIVANNYIPFKRNPNYLSDIYMVPEEFVLPAISINCYIKAFMPLYPKFDRSKLESILTEFELNRNSNLNKLSHGQRKKFLIAFALASNCGLLILDEPTNGLDIPSKSLFRKILVSSVSEEQLVLISTHQVKDIETIINEVIVVNDGAIAFQSQINEIADKYSFETVSSLNAFDSVIYHEKSPMGYRVIIPSLDNDSDVDLELLFNAIINKSI